MDFYIAQKYCNKEYQEIYLIENIKEETYKRAKRIVDELQYYKEMFQKSLIKDLQVDKHDQQIVLSQQMIFAEEFKIHFDDYKRELLQEDLGAFDILFDEFTTYY